MKIRILYFMSLVELFGKTHEEITIPTTIQTIEQLLKFLSTRCHSKQNNLQESLLTITLNKKFVTPDAIIKENDEIALVPKRQ
jgi:molybdopterin converting factor small subunit